MKTVVIKVNDSKNTIAEIAAVTKDGQPTIIQSQKGVNYEFFDQSIRRAPNHIITKREGNHLLVSFEREGREFDLIIEDYYLNGEQPLIGLAENNSYYYFIPDTGEVYDYVSQLEAGDIEGQALGGDELLTPWWLGAQSFNVWPWLVGLAGVGTIAALINDDDSDDQPPAPKTVDVLVSIEDNVALVTEGGSATFLIELRDTDGNLITSNKNVTIEVAYSGTANNGQDYHGTTMVTIPAGNSAVNLVIDTLTDDIKEGTEEVGITLTKVEGGDFDTLTIDTKTSGDYADMVIADPVNEVIPPIPDVVANNDGSVTITPDTSGDDDATTVEVTYTPKEDDSPITVLVSKNPTTGQWTVEDPDSPVMVDSSTGVVTISDDAVKDGTPVIAKTTDEEGDTGTDVDTTPEKLEVSIMGETNVNEGVGSVAYTVSIDKPATMDTFVTVEVTNGTAKVDEDYTLPTTLTVKIPEGQTSAIATIDVPIIDDNVYEGAEDYTIKIIDVTGSNAVIDSNNDSVITRIHDDGTIDGSTPVDPSNPTVGNDIPQVTITGKESINESAGLAIYTVSLSNPSVEDTTITYNIEDISTSGAQDYNATGLVSVTIPAGATEATIELPIVDDTTYEGKEEFKIILTGVIAGTATIGAKDSVTTAIYDDGTTDGTNPFNPSDPTKGNDTPSISVDNKTVDEDAGTMTFTVTLSNDSVETVTVDYATADQSPVSAKAGVDYTSTNGSLTFAPGEITKEITVTILDDNIAEGDETFDLKLSNVSGNATIADELGVGTIQDEGAGAEDAVQVYIVDKVGSITEGDTGTFTIKLKDTNGNDITAVSEVTANLNVGGSATSGEDYTALTSTITIPAGSNSIDLPVKIIDDYIADTGETVEVTLSGVSGGGFEAIEIDSDNNFADLTIIDETTVGTEDTVYVSILDNVNSVDEGQKGTFPIILKDKDGDPVNAKETTTVTFTYTGSAENDEDYTGVATVSIPAGSSSTALEIQTLTDNLDEVLEDVQVTITNVTGGGFEAIEIDTNAKSANMDIVDTNEAPTLSVDDAMVDEDAGTMTFTVTLSGSTPTENVTVDYATADQSPVSAKAGVDYTSTNGSLTFAPGEITKEITVTILDDSIAEGDETFDLKLSNVSGNATIADEIGVGTIQDEGAGAEDAVTVSISGDATVAEGSEATYKVSLTDANGVAINAQEDMTVSVSYTHIDTETGDIVETQRSVTISAETSFETFTVEASNDAIYEGNEDYSVVITNPTDGGFEAVIVGIDTATTTIIDNDTAPSVLSVSSEKVEEGTNLVHTVTLSGESGSNETYVFSLSDGTATEGEDYTNPPIFSNGVTYDATTELITVPAGVTEFTVTYPTINDTVDEADETTTLTVGGVSGIGTITDNDNTPVIAQLSDASVVESGNLTHTVTLSAPSETKVLYNITLTGNTAKNSIDFDNDLLNAIFTNGVTFDATNAQIEVPAGVTSFTITYQTNNDIFVEADETTSLTVGTKTATGTIKNDDDTSSIRLSEEGLSAYDGIEDTDDFDNDASTTYDTTNDASGSGTIEINEDITSITGPTNVKSQGQNVDWTWDSGSKTLTGITETSKEKVMTLTVNDTDSSDGVDYDVALFRSVDHPDGDNIEGELAINFAVNTNTGQTVDFTTVIEDDMPFLASAETIEVSTYQVPKVNLTVALDISGSMSRDDVTGYTSRLEAAKDALKTLIETYQELAELKINIITFATTANSITGNQYVDGATALAAINGVLTAEGYTNYDAALADVIDSINNDSGQLPNALNDFYFLSDGSPTVGDGNTSVLQNSNGNSYDGTFNFDEAKDYGVNAAELTTWIGFVNSNNISAYAVGFGGIADGSDAQEELNKIAYDGVNDIDTNGDVIDIDDLKQTLVDKIKITPVDDNVVRNGNLIGVTQVSSADTFSLVEMTIEGVTYSYNEASDTITKDGNQTILGSKADITTQAGSTLTVDFATGEFIHEMLPQLALARETEVIPIEYTIKDKDGDGGSRALTTLIFRPEELMTGSDEDDVLIGTESGENITGGAGDDVIVGNNGNDTLTGGAGADVFLWQDDDMGTTASPEVDTVTDFDLTENDVLSFSELLPNATDANLANYVAVDGANMYVNTSGNVDTVAGSYDLKIVLTGNTSSLQDLIDGNHIIL